MPNQEDPELAAKLREVSGWIRQDESGHYSSTRFDNLSISAFVAQRTVAATGLAAHARFLHKDWTNLLTIIAKIDWMTQARQSDALHEHSWMLFVASDIDMFHIENRSAFDHLAGVIRALSTRPGQVPDVSYNELIKWCDQNQPLAQRLLGDAIPSAVVESRAWFKQLRDIRDDSVHRGSESLVFLTGPRICFQYYLSSAVNRVQLPLVMYNENIVDFALYSALQACRLWDLCELVAQRAFEVCSLQQVGHGDGTRAYHGGKAQLRASVGELLARLGSAAGSGTNAVTEGRALREPERPTEG